MTNINSSAVAFKTVGGRKKFKKFLCNYELYILLLPALVYFLVFHYYPMYGVQIAFKDFIASKGIWGSPWIGFDHFERLFNSYFFANIIKNTFWISIYTLVVGFPVPIIMALMLNEVKNSSFKRIVQTVTYAPHFISMTVMVGIIIVFLSPGSGIVNLIIKALGGDPMPFMAKADWFPTVFVLSGIWQNTGWNAIIYLAALAGIDPELHSAAQIDGANRIQRIWYINLPGIVPIITILLILNAGSIMNLGFEKIFLMQNQLNLETSEVIVTYVYKSGLINAQYGFSAAVGLFNSVVNCTLLVLFNSIARISENSLW